MGLMRRAPLSIELDFVAARRGPRWYGWALLVAGIAGAALAFGDYRTEQAELAERQKTLERLRESVAHAAPTQRAAGGRSVSPDEAKAALEVAAHLNAAWGRLFAGMAAAQTESATWISFDGDASRNSVRIAGDARNLSAVFDLLERLNGAEGIRDARLSSYEWTNAGAVPVVRFHATATWGSGQ
ncbi:MAG TPA: hypothetical protein VJ673_14455 [Aromatoleum sp.]|uniref:hypothetical protein n=1 Tax=Aromatoleum sp. TaxID=2307007 RepID=UPI002B4847C2|nr:hypothetical protein [Aromatoleum sp.]HJV26886.1 hypothetical protein [Aromatoleum sp.]